MKKYREVLHESLHVHYSQKRVQFAFSGKFSNGGLDLKR